MINSSCFFLQKGLFLSPAHHSGLLSTCVGVGNVLLRNEEAVLGLIFKDVPLLLGALGNVRLNSAAA